MSDEEAREIAKVLREIALERIEQPIFAELANEVLAQLPQIPASSSESFANQVNSVFTFLAAHAVSATRDDVASVLNQISKIASNGSTQIQSVVYVDPRTERASHLLDILPKLDDSEAELRDFIKLYAIPVDNEFNSDLPPEPKCQ
jgi:hypothetical protein